MTTCIVARSGLRYNGVNGSRMPAIHRLQARKPLRPRASRLKCMAFDVTLLTPDGEKKVQCDGDTFILDAADEAGLDLPYSCRSGTCGTCAAKLEKGDMSQIDQVHCAISSCHRGLLFLG